MKVLEEEFLCPLAFDRVRNGYHLQYRGGDFIAPVLPDENEMLAAVIGVRIAEEIFPAPLKNRIREFMSGVMRAVPPFFSSFPRISLCLSCINPLSCCGKSPFPFPVSIL